ncbi:MAG: serine/threonine-protein kinase [Acidobacteriota bacterium]
MKRWRSVETLFEQATALPEAERRSFLEATCGTDRELLDEVLSLLDADRSATTRLETPALELEARRLARRLLLPAGSRLDDYQIQRLICAGSSAAVYRATDRRTGDPVALKVFPAGTKSDGNLRRRFRREARALAALTDPRVPRLLGSGETEELRYLVEEYVQGETLQEWMLRHQPAQDEIVQLAVQIAEVLAQAHAKGLVHRDIKPSNLMITSAGQVKVLDFGIVKFQEAVDGETQLDSRAGTLTRDGAVLGTLDYMSPEQIMGRPVDHRTDLFNLGLLLYQLTTGRMPFQSNSFPRKIALLTEWQLPPAGALVPDLDSRLARVIDRCLRRDPEERYQSAEELLADLRPQAEDPAKGDTVQNDHRVLLTIDALVNLALGVALLLFPSGVARELGLPVPDTGFYASLLGAILFGIGLALLLECRSTPSRLRGLGLGGAIAINLAGGGTLLVWLAIGSLGIPLRGYVILWIVDLVVLFIGAAELKTIYSNRR